MSDLVCRPGDKGYVDPGSDLWHEHLGCSQVADILGHGYGSRKELWLAKTHRKAKPEHKLIYDRGHEMEPKMARDVRAAGRVLVAEQVQYRDPDRPWLIYHADGIFPKWTPLTDGATERHGPGVWEAKAPGFHMAHKMREEGMSEGYIDQTQVGMHVASRAMGQGFTWATFGYLDYDAYETIMFDCPAMKDYQEKCLALIDEFWDCVVRDVPPEPIHPSAIPVVPEVRGEKEVVTEGRLVELAADLALLEDQFALSELKQRDARIRAEMKEIMGERGLVEIPGVYRFSYKYGKPSEKVTDPMGLLAYCEWLTSKYTALIRDCGLDDEYAGQALAGSCGSIEELQNRLLPMHPTLEFRRSDWVQQVEPTRSFRPTRIEE